MIIRSGGRIVFLCVVLCYVQLLLVGICFWSTMEAVAGIFRRQWPTALPFGGVVLLCLLIPKSGWFLLALVDGVMLIVDHHRAERDLPGQETTLHVYAVCITSLVLLDLMTLGLLLPLGRLAAWLIVWLPLIVLAGVVYAFLTRNNFIPPAPASRWHRWCEKFGHAIDEVIACWHRGTLRQVCSKLMVASGARLSARLTQTVSNFRRMLRDELTGLIEVVSGTPPTLKGLSSWRANIECLWMRISVSEPGGLPSWQTHFPQETTKYINLAGEVLVLNWTQGVLLCPCAYRYYNPDGNLLAEKREDVLIKSYQERFSFAWGWGWPEPGHWEPGAYHVKLYLAGELLQTAGFIIDPPPPPPSWTLADILSQARVWFYASQTEYDARQDSVRFTQDTTRQITCVLTVRNHFYQHHDETYLIIAQCYTPEGKILWEDHRDWLIKAGEERASISWAWQESGPWKAGAYRLEIDINWEEFAWGAFLIE